MSEAPAARIGRPPKIDADGISTRERLLRSAVEAYADYGYDGVTLAEIARRADVSTPAIYNHFTSRTELLVEASRAAIRGFLPETRNNDMDLHRVVEQWTDDTARSGRRMIAELHLVSMRNEEIRATLNEWHQERFDALTANDYNPARVKASYLLLLGLSLIDSIDDLDVDPDDLLAEITRMADSIVPLTD